MAMRWATALRMRSTEPDSSAWGAVASSHWRVPVPERGASSSAAPAPIAAPTRRPATNPLPAIGGLSVRRRAVGAEEGLYEALGPRHDSIQLDNGTRRAVVHVFNRAYHIHCGVLRGLRRFLHRTDQARSGVSNCHRL